MKKIYQNPTMRIVKVQPMQMLSESVAVGAKFQQNDVVLSKGRRGIFQDGDNVEENQSIW